MGSCWSCGNRLEPNEYHRQDSCPRCGRDTHACKNCGFHDRAFNNECRESSADRVVDKEKANFCDFFQPSDRPGTGGGKGPDELRKAAEALFRKK